MKRIFYLFLGAQLFTAAAFAQTGTQVKTVNGTVEGTSEDGLRVYRGLPFAQPPVGDLRWKEPQPVKNWDGVLKADHFAHNGMQKQPFGDMGFRTPGGSEDCLYLNVWTPAKSANAKLPVLVYFYGGGYVAGDGSEPRYDGASMAQKGIVAVTINYRLGIFGFLAHPELTKESPNHSSGNYGMLDQNAALKWVQANIAAFGGDPAHVTIAGESAGSISVAAQMASPLSKDLIAGAIGESGAMIKPTLAAIPLAEGEKNGLAFAAKVNATSLADLRAMPADKLLDESTKRGAFVTAATIDGYFLPKPLVEIFKAGEQAHVPLLVGWNSAEVPYQFMSQGKPVTKETYPAILKTIYGDRTDEALKLYPAGTEEEALKSATEMASDRFIVYSTWKWADLQLQTGGKSVYRYLFSRVRPAMVAAMGNATAGFAGGVVKNSNAPAAAPAPHFNGASHASEIEYAMGNLASNKVYAWTPDDYKVSVTMENYFANFIKTFNPNGKGVPKWPALTATNGQYINIDVKTEAKPDDYRPRYLFLDQEYSK